MKTKNGILSVIITGLALIFTTSCIQSLTFPLPVLSTVTDVDGNVYNTREYGTQVWMVENLNTAHYRNGDPIFYPEDQFWGLQTSGACCDYDNDPNNSLIYGKLYNGYAVQDSRNIAPLGWHVATEADWTTLNTFLGTPAGDQLKEAGSSHWVTSPNSSPNAGTNSSGFKALPGGYRDNYFLPQGLHSGTYIGFNSIGTYGFWWTATPGPSSTPQYETAITRRLQSYNNTLSANEYFLTFGMSVRCVKD